MGSGSALVVPDVIISGGHDGITAADLDNNAITGAGLACIVSGGIQSGHNVKALVIASHNISPPYLDALNSAEKNQKANRMQDNITCRIPLYHAKTLVCGALATLCVYIRVRGL